MTNTIPIQYNSSVKGYCSGYQIGYRLGCCETIRNQIKHAKFIDHDCRVLLIPQGFEATDTGVIDGFRGLIPELVIGSQQEILESARSVHPDLVVVMSGLRAFPCLDQIEAVRALGVKTAIWFTDELYDTDYTSRIGTHFDYVFTHEYSYVQLFKSIGCKEVHYLPYAVCNNLYRPFEVDEKYRSDICFVGNAIPNRFDFFNAIAPYLASKKVMIIGAHWDQLEQYPLLSKQIHPNWMPIEETIKYYNGAKIVVNFHPESEDLVDTRISADIRGSSANLRTFEINSCAAFQLSDARDDLHDLYAVGKEIETYNSPTEFIRKAEYYLKHDRERSHIAYRGYSRTLKDHTFKHRINQLLKVTALKEIS
ncbi:spore maturation protein [Paenibacillus albiflavus]|uniref:Spore maturation protein n=1 Tax=Paenibacillus albiflavus TaxID=2545760 RepID=A0A4R4E1H9_9BACL|nr:glycosyltransferase [Paenibacillus albiflavus]TCZ73209.1 spore maturation protein [Paenibacillus albiflavus]